MPTESTFGFIFAKKQPSIGFWIGTIFFVPDFVAVPE
jgi:hypothetical protein